MKGMLLGPTKALRTCRFVVDVRRRLGSGKKVTPASAAWLRTELQSMGAAYIKIGQFVSSRADMFDASLVEVLRELQDNVQSAPQDGILEVIRGRLGDKNLKENFAWIDATPMACASIGQVHAAQTKTGKRLALKVRRPGVLDEVAGDLDLITALTSLLKLTGVKNVDETLELIDDFRTWFSEETDFRNEVTNWKLLRAAQLKRSSTQDGRATLIMPTYYAALCTEDFVVMSYVPSKKFRDVKVSMSPSARKSLAFELMDSFVSMLINDGVMHGDPHEGNIGVDDRGRIVLYDLGNVIRVSSKTRTRLKRLLFDISTNDLDAAIQQMKSLPELMEVRDETKTRKLLQGYVDYIRTIDISAFRASVVATEMNGDLPIKFGGVVFRIIRVFGLLEGICKELDDEFSYEPIFMKYARVIGGDSEYISYKASSDIRRLADAIIQRLED